MLKWIEKLRIKWRERKLRRKHQSASEEEYIPMASTIVGSSYVPMGGYNYRHPVQEHPLGLDYYPQYLPTTPLSGAYQSLIDAPMSYVEPSPSAPDEPSEQAPSQDIFDSYQSSSSYETPSSSDSVFGSSSSDSGSSGIFDSSSSSSSDSSLF